MEVIGVGKVLIRKEGPSALKARGYSLPGFI